MGEPRLLVPLPVPCCQPLDSFAQLRLVLQNLSDFISQLNEDESHIVCEGETFIVCLVVNTRVSIGGPDMQAQVGDVQGAGDGTWLFNIMDVYRHHPVLTFNFASKEAADNAHSKMESILADTIEVHFHRY